RNNSSIRTLAFSPKGDWLVGGDYNGVVGLWDMNAQDISASFKTLTGHSSSIRYLAFDADGHWLASASDDSTVRLWDMTVQDPSASPNVLRGHSGPVYSLAFSADNHWLVSAGDDAAPRLWDISAQSELLKPEQEISAYEMIASLGGHTKGINALSFNSDGTQLASASDETTIRLWNFQTGLPTEANSFLQSVYGSGSVNTLFFFGGSSDGGLVVGTEN
ncbi:hypothetical protein JZU71_02010, partial [bacterium]|nr:hypothetical protein [bacterium]